MFNNVNPTRFFPGTFRIWSGLYLLDARANGPGSCNFRENQPNPHPARYFVTFGDGMHFTLRPCIRRRKR